MRLFFLSSHRDATPAVLAVASVTLAMVGVCGCGDGPAASTGAPDPDVAHVTIEAPAGIQATIEAADLPRPPPDGLVLLGPTVDIHVDQTDEPVLVSFEIGSLPADTVPVVAHDTGTDWELIGAIDWDESAGVVRAFALDFSIYTVFGVPTSALPESHSVPIASFDPAIAGFGIVNDGVSPFSPDGHCIGMAAFSRDYGLAYHASDEHLSTLWTEQDQRILAARAFKGLDRVWFGSQLTLNLAAEASYLGVFVDELAKYLLATRDEPVLIVLQRGESCADSGCHAVLAFGYEGDDLLLLDSNHPGTTQRMTVLGNAMTTYGPYTRWNLVPSGQVGTWSLASLLSELDPAFSTDRLTVLGPTDTTVDLAAGQATAEVRIDIDAPAGFDEMVAFVDEDAAPGLAWNPTTELYLLELAGGTHVVSLLAAGPDDSALTHLEITVANASCGNGVVDPGEAWDDGSTCG